MPSDDQSEHEYYENDANEDFVTVTHFSDAQFRADPQVGTVVTRDWQAFAKWLKMPKVSPNKTGMGAWCPTVLPGGAVKDGKGDLSLLVADVDDCTHGAIQRHAETLDDLQGLIIPTYSWSFETPKHRIVLKLSRAIDPYEFTIIWPKMARDFETLGILVDKGCKNLNRLYFACATPDEDTWRASGGSIELRGQPLPVDDMLRAAQAEYAEQEAVRARKNAAKAPFVGFGGQLQSDRDRYIGGAVKSAKSNLRGASAGDRHNTLLKEVFGLTRFGLTQQQVESELLEDFVAVAGEERRLEGQKAIRDAHRASLRKLGEERA